MVENLEPDDGGSGVILLGLWSNHDGPQSGRLVWCETLRTVDGKAGVALELDRVNLSMKSSRTSLASFLAGGCVAADPVDAPPASTMRSAIPMLRLLREPFLRPELGRGPPRGIWSFGFRFGLSPRKF
jgi:hypothetical protein